MRGNHEAKEVGSSVARKMSLVILSRKGENLVYRVRGNLVGKEVGSSIYVGRFWPFLGGF